MNLRLALREITDRYVRSNFEKLQAALRSEPLLKGQFRFLSAEFAEAATEAPVAHGLGFVPLDVIPTSLKGAGSLTWVYEKFDKDYVYVTTTGACEVRAFVGRYEEGSNG